MSTLEHDIVVSVIDKVLLGGVALLVAYLFNRRLELFRAQQTVRTEFVRERTRRLDLLYTLMHDLQRAGNDLVSGTRKGSLTEDQKRYDKFLERSNDLQRAATLSRPWIGDTLTDICEQYDIRVGHMVAEQMNTPERDVWLVEALRKSAAELEQSISAAIQDPVLRSLRI
jgi:hypothetical protein